MSAVSSFSAIMYLSLCQSNWIHSVSKLYVSDFNVDMIINLCIYVLTHMINVFQIDIYTHESTYSHVSIFPLWSCLQILFVLMFLYLMVQMVQITQLKQIDCKPIRIYFSFQRDVVLDFLKKFFLKFILWSRFGTQCRSNSCAFQIQYCSI